MLECIEMGSCRLRGAEVCKREREMLVRGYICNWERDALAPYLIVFSTIMEVYQLIMPLH